MPCLRLTSAKKCWMWCVSIAVVRLCIAYTDGAGQADLLDQAIAWVEARFDQLLEKLETLGHKIEE